MLFCWLECLSCGYWIVVQLTRFPRKEFFLDHELRHVSCQMDNEFVFVTGRLCKIFGY